MGVTGGPWNDYPDGPDRGYWGHDFPSGGGGGGFWGNNEFGGGYQQNYGGGPIRGGFGGGGGGRPVPYSGLLHFFLLEITCVHLILAPLTALKFKCCQ